MRRQGIKSFFLVLLLLLSSLTLNSIIQELEGKNNSIIQTPDNIKKTKAQSGIFLVKSESVPLSSKLVYNLITLPYSIVTLENHQFNPNDYFANIGTSYFRSEEFENIGMQLDYINQSSYLSRNQVNGSGVIVAVVDTGIDFNHEAMVGTKYKEKSFQLKSLGYDEDLGPEDNNGHGTAVASLIAGQASGFSSLGRGAKLVNAKIGIENGIITSASVIAAIDWSISLQEVDIISISLGEPEEGPGMDVIEELVNSGVRAGKIIVTSAGNRGTGSNSHNPFTIGSPGSSVEAITVGSVNSINRVSSFSSQGPTIRYEAKPDVVTLGEGITAARRNGGYAKVSGTSFSTPMVSGLAASLVSQLRFAEKEYSPGGIKALILNTSDDIGYISSLQGFGELNTTRVVDSILQNQINEIIGPRDLYLPFSKIPAGEYLKFPITTISSTLGPWEFSIDNEDMVINFEEKYSGYSSIYDLQISIPANFEVGEINITLFAKSPNNLEQFIPISLAITIPVEYRVLLDYAHTNWDTLIFGDSYKQLERMHGIDLKNTIEYFQQNSMWVYEFIEGELTEEILGTIDLLWMPSAFTITKPFPYDHPLSRSNTLTQNEFFAIREFISQGGDILLDFGGTSLYDDEFDVIETDVDSLNSISSIFGFIPILSNGIDDLQKSINSTGIINQVYDIPTGTAEFLRGIPFINGSQGYSGVGSISPSGGKAYFHNSRNWRDGTNFFTNSSTENYTKSVYNWLKNDNSISSFVIRDDNGLIIEFDFINVSTSEIKVEVQLNDLFIKIDEIVKTTDNLWLKLDEYSEGDRLNISLLGSDITFNLISTIDFTPPVVQFIEVEQFANRLIISGIIEDGENIPHQNMKINLIDPKIDNAVLLKNGTKFEIVLFSISPEDVLSLVNNLRLTIIDLNNNLGEYSPDFELVSLGPTSSNTQNSLSTTSSRPVVTILVFPLIILILLVRSNQVRKQEK